MRTLIFIYLGVGLLVAEGALLVIRRAAPPPPNWGFARPYMLILLLWPFLIYWAIGKLRSRRDGES